MKALMNKMLDIVSKYGKVDARYILAGNFWLTIGRGVAAITGLALTYTFANFVSKETFGTYKYVLSITGIISSFGLYGLGTAVVNAVAQGKRGILPSVFTGSIRWALIGSFTALVLCIYYFFKGNTVLGFSMLFLAVFHPLNMSFGLSKSFLSGKADFRGLARYGTVRNFLVVATMVAVLFIFENNVIAVVGTYFAANILTGAWMYYAAIKKHETPGEMMSLEDKKRVITYGKHISIMNVLTQTSSQLDQFLLWHFGSPGAVAAYSIASAPVKELRSVSENLMPLALPKFAKKEIADVKNNLPFRVVQLLFLSIIAMAIYILVAPLLFKFLFPQYPEAVIMSQVIALTFLLQPKGLIETMFLAHARKKEQYINTVITHTIKIILLISLIPLYGIWGAIASIIIADIISMSVMWYLLKQVS